MNQGKETVFFEAQVLIIADEGSAVGGYCQCCDAISSSHSLITMTGVKAVPSHPQSTSFSFRKIFSGNANHLFPFSPLFSLLLLHLAPLHTTHRYSSSVTPVEADTHRANMLGLATSIAHTSALPAQGYSQARCHHVASCKQSEVALKASPGTQPEKPVSPGLSSLAWRLWITYPSWVLAERAMPENEKVLAFMGACAI